MHPTLAAIRLSTLALGHKSARHQSKSGAAIITLKECKRDVRETLLMAGAEAV